MKNIIYTLALLFSFSAFAQIGEAKDTPEVIMVGKVTNPYKWVTLQYTMSGEDKLYLLSFRNQEYTELEDIGSISFTATDDELDYLYKTFHSMLKARGESKTIEIGDGKMVLNGIYNSFELYVYKDGTPTKHTWLNKGQINKLFARKK